MLQPNGWRYSSHVRPWWEICAETGRIGVERSWNKTSELIPVEPHEAVPEVSKGKVHITQNKHVPIEWFVTTASQSRIWLKLLSDDSNKVCLLCRSTQLHATTSCRSQFATTCGSSYVLQSSTPYWKSTTLYYKVLIQYYSVLQSTTPVLLCTWSVLLQYYSVLQSTNPVLQSTTPVLLSTTKYYSVLHSTTPVLLCATPVLLCTTKYYSSTTLYYKVLLQYYSVLQSTTPVLLRTTQYYSSTTLYYTVLLQYYSVLQSTTKYYSSTTLYYKVLLQYYSVLQSTTPVLLCTTKNYSSTLLHYKVLLQYYSVLQSTTPVLLSWLIRVTYETLFTMRGTTEVLLQNHRLLRLPRKMTLMIDPHHIWNVSYNARSNRDVSPTSPTTAPATKSNTHHWSSSHLKRYLQCAEQHVS